MCCRLRWERTQTPCPHYSRGSGCSAVWGRRPGAARGPRGAANVWARRHRSVAQSTSVFPPQPTLFLGNLLFKNLRLVFRGSPARAVCRQLGAGGGRTKASEAARCESAPGPRLVGVQPPAGWGAWIMGRLDLGWWAVQAWAPATPHTCPQFPGQGWCFCLVPQAARGRAAAARTVRDPNGHNQGRRGPPSSGRAPRPLGLSPSTSGGGGCEGLSGAAPQPVLCAPPLPPAEENRP